jgi:hypothetical protein
MIFNGLNKQRSLACGVLFLASAMSYGCIIPDTFTKQQDVNFQPVFVPSDVSPPFGRVLTGVAESDLDLKFVVDDQNLFDTLRVRVFTERTIGGVQQRVPLPFEVVLDASVDAEHPNRRQGRPIIPTNYCNLVANPNAAADLIAIVCDRQFGGNSAADLAMSDMAITAPDECPGGLTDERIWTLLCQ